MAEPPVSVGAVQDRSICVLPLAVAVSSVGLPGAVGVLPDARSRSVTSLVDDQSRLVSHS